MFAKRFLPGLLLWSVCFLPLLAAGQPPAGWSISPQEYQYSMTFTTLLAFDNNISTDTADVVAAFRGNECRGVAHTTDTVLSQEGNLAFLMVYSNRIEGDTIHFKLFDASTGRTVDIPHRVLFRPNAAYGLPSRPLLNVAERKLIAFNYFSPNGDGHNDYWKIKNIHMLIDYELYIFDSNGYVLLHQQAPYLNDWNGKYNGKKLPQGIYYYLIKGPTGEDMYKGTVSLVR